ncbi:rhomboid family intramembrane serine protease, partial [Butyricicoccus sp. 1XD8-22]
MFIRRESFKQYIKLYPVVSSIIAINLIVYILMLLPGMEYRFFIYGASIN